MTLLVSAGSIMLFGVIGVLMAWMSGDATDDLAEKWADYGIVLDENCESGPLEQNMDDDTPGIWLSALPAECRALVCGLRRQRNGLLSK